MILNEIIQKKQKDLAEMKRRLPLHRLREAAQQKPRSAIRSFSRALSHSQKLNLICEIKKASPSGGVLREDFQPLRIASQFEHAGAAAISILTEPHFFKGRPSYLKTVRRVTHLPILRKDFIFETYQIYETAVLEADAFLLIASLLTDTELRELIELGKSLEMEALVEIHSDDDLKKAVQAGASLLGINNRDLKTLTVDIHTAKRLLPHVPKGCQVVVESGIEQHEHLLEYKSLGVHAFLIGTSIMKAPDIVEKIHNLLGKDQKWKP